MCLVILIFSAIIIVPALIFTNNNKSAQTENITESSETAKNEPTPDDNAPTVTTQPQEEAQVQGETSAETQAVSEMETTTTENNSVDRVTASFKTEYLNK